jgi:serine/tyrosine/threonine adenylyltransferase
VEAALSAAVENDDLVPFERLLAVLLHPFDEQPNAAIYALPALADQSIGYRTFCGT